MKCANSKFLPLSTPNFAAARGSINSIPYLMGESRSKISALPSRSQEPLAVEWLPKWEHNSGRPQPMATSTLSPTIPGLRYQGVPACFFFLAS